ncbi:Zinc finger protein ZAT3 [Vitis vinifera]|uniref:Zinc finger protein ZAT3 n=1 Tax=Vitis vinifera TaxID=29760 RepID=A0A438EKX7_VITVI|nr:Zinc finger protein ZAT3 [Vitis vinifera]
MRVESTSDGSRNDGLKIHWTWTGNTENGLPASDKQFLVTVKKTRCRMKIEAGCPHLWEILSLPKERESVINAIEVSGIKRPPSECLVSLPEDHSRRIDATTGHFVGMKSQHWEERNLQLQRLLRKLDQSNQEDYLQMLRSLSSIELSRHAVKLERRSIQLSLEEGKHNMFRLQLSHSVSFSEMYREVRHHDEEQTNLGFVCLPALVVETFGNLDSSQQSGSNYQIQNQNPRKKRSKLIRIDPSVVASSSGIVKAKSGKKADPSAPKITRPCSECGKKFWSWKALFGHMSEDDHEVAACLLMLANGAGPIERISHCMLAYQADGADGLDALGGGCRFECSSWEDEDRSGGHERDGDGEVKENLEEKMMMVLGAQVQYLFEGCSLVVKPWVDTRGFGLDLNLPAPLEDDSYCSHSSNLALDLRLGL